jgi:hypothetical protein
VNGQVQVTLTGDLVWRAALAGIQRQLHSLGKPDAHGFNGDGWGVHVEGCGAELAFASTYAKAWVPVHDDFKGLPGDVEGTQVRSTPRANGCLLIHPSDPDDKPFVLVTGRIPSFVLRGWCYGEEGKHTQWWNTSTGRPCFFVPQTALRPMPAVPGPGA